MTLPLLCLLAALGRAEPEDPALTSLRAAHQTALKSAQETLAKKQMESLRILEAACVEQADYAGAEQVAQALAALEKNVALAVKANSTILDGRIPHTVSYGALEKNNLIQINKNNGAIRWEGVSLPPARYQVKLTFSVDAPASGAARSVPTSGSRASAETPAWGGQIQLSEITSLGGAKALTYRVPHTVTQVEKNTVDLGFLTTTGARTTLVLKATEAYSEGVMTFHALELIAVNAEANPASVGGDNKEFTSLQEEYRKQLQEKTSGAHKAWLTKLQDLAKSATNSANTEALDLIKPELERVTLLVNPTTATLPVAAVGQKVLLPAFDPLVATFNSEIRISTSKDCLQRLRPAGARVSFKLAAAKVLPGTYQVTLNINQGSGMGGNYVVSCGEHKVSGTLEGSGSLVRQAIALPKPLIISADAKYLEFSVESLANSVGSLCELRSIELTPEKVSP